jgi:Fur family ferric uptake transcriptional regulator
LNFESLAEASILDTVKSSHNLEIWRNHLRTHGLKCTKAREIILDVLESGPCLQSVDEIVQKISEILPENAPDWTTVYRSLIKFEEVGLLRSAHLGDGHKRYELVTPDGRHHHHVICRSCQSVRPLPSCALSVVEKGLEQEGYSNLSHQLEFFGVCPACTI